MKNTNTSEALLPGDSIENVRKLLNESAANMYAAAAMLTRICAKDKTVVEKLTSGPNGYPEGFINGLLRVGEKSLHPQILLNRCPAYRRLSTMAYSTQEAVINKGSVEVVIDANTGDVVMVDVTKLDGDQLNQAISTAGVRSRDEQRAWLKRHAVATAAPKDVGPPYILKKDRLCILRGNFEFTRVDLLRLLEQMVG